YFPSAEACNRAVRCDLTCMPCSKTLMDTLGSLACSGVILYTMVPPLPSPASSPIIAPEMVIHRLSSPGAGGLVPLPGPSSLEQPAMAKATRAAPQNVFFI